MIEQGMNTAGAFSPGTPINPFEPVGTPPQQFQFQIGLNIVQQPRSTEEISFDTMRNVLKNYDVAQMCIENRLDQLKFLDWEVVRRDEKDKTDYSSDIKKVEAFLHKPDGFTLFDDWLSMVGNDLLSYDAPAIFKHKTRGGKLGALEVIDGTTITPLLDGRGMIPKPPAPAYIQYTYGMPRYWLTSDSLIYRPWRRRSSTVYGYPPVEWLLMNINQDIRQQYYFLQYFTDGSVPDVFAETPEVISADTEKIRQFQQYYDAVMLGDQSQRHKVKWIPFGSKVTMMKDQNFNIDYPTWLFNKTLAAFKTTPAELGFTENVNKSSGDSQENVTYRRSIRPMAKYMEALMNEILVELGYPHLSFAYQNLGEEEDELVAAQVREIDIRNGVISPDQAAEEIYGIQPDPKNPTPRVFMTGSTFTTLEDAIVNSKAMAQKALADAQNATNPTQPQVNDGSQVKDGKPPQNGNVEAADGKNKQTQPDAKDQLPDDEKAKRPGDAKKLFKAEGDDEKKKHVLPESDYLAMNARQDALQEVIASFFQTQPKELARHIIDGIKNEQVSAETAPTIVDRLLKSYGWEGWEKHLKPAVYQSLVETVSQGGMEAAISIFKRFATTMREVGMAEAFAELMSPAVWIALAVAAVVALAMVIIQHWSQIKAFLQKSWEETKKIATEVWGAVSKFFTDVWTEISSYTVTEWNKIKQFFTDLWVKIGSEITSAVNSIKQTWQDFITGIKNLWNEFKTWISNTAHAAMQGIVDAFNWMYNHNYYFKDLVDYITNEWNIIKTTTIQIWDDVTKWLKDTWTTISNDASAIWNDVKTFFSNLWDGIKQVAEAFWEDEKRGFERIWNAIVTAANTVWTPIKTFFSGIWDDISSGASARWDEIKSTMSTLWNGIISDAESIFDGLETYFTGLWDKALNWGSNLVHMVAQGIRNAAGEVAQAASSVASSIAGFLGFHSPAKMGPGSDADKWMPNLFKMLTDQVQKQIPTMNAALSMAFHPQMTGVTNMNMYQNMSPVTSGTGSSVVIQNVVNVSGNITQNEQALGNIVSKALIDKMKFQGKIG